MEKMKFSRPLILGALVSFLGLVFLTEILLRLTVPSGFWYRHFDLTTDLTSLAEVRDRLRFGDLGGVSRAYIPGRRVLVLGDSVLGGSALTEHRVPGARQLTLGSDLKEILEDRGNHLVTLAADGALLPDLLALTTEAFPGGVNGPPPPGQVLLLLNYRMFTQELASGPKALSRVFLKEDLPASFFPSLGKDPKRTEETDLSDRLYAFLCQHCFLFRETQMAKTLWYYPTQKDFFQHALESVLGAPNEDEDLAEASLKLKIAPYYQAYRWPADGLPYQSLGLILQRLKGAGIPVKVVLTPQNPGFLGDYVDKPSFEANRKGLGRFMKDHAFPGLDYEDWSGLYPPSSFLDHCHLTPEGNHVYAKDLAGLLTGIGRGS
jgi:hypothetical protein